MLKETECARALSPRRGPHHALVLRVLGWKCGKERNEINTALPKTRGPRATPLLRRLGWRSARSEAEVAKRILLFRSADAALQACGSAVGGGYVPSVPLCPLPGDERDAYLSAEPAGDARFITAFAHSLEHAGGYSPAEARQVASTLLPDIMRFDPKRPASYPQNGRLLTDDVSDHFLSILTNGKVTTDKVGRHSDLLTEFPYLGPPHKAASARRVA